MKFFQATVILSLSIPTILGSPNPLPNEIKDRATAAGVGGSGEGEHTPGGFESVLEAAWHHGLAPGWYSFYAIWEKEDQGIGNEDLTRLTTTIGGSHYALVVGELRSHRFKGTEVDARFKQHAQLKPNGNGEELQVVKRQFREDFGVRYKYLGKVAPNIDETKIDRKGMVGAPGYSPDYSVLTSVLSQPVSEVFVKTYHVQSNNCKTFVDKLHASLQRSDGGTDSGPARGQRTDVQRREQPKSRPCTCRCQ
ncbi:hypothetical protein MMC30_001284 [Trapelia coarctata]|nr:hypothetical protein [Trapelia coarctata]